MAAFNKLDNYVLKQGSGVSFYNYITSLARKWCNENSINFQALTATLLIAAFTGDIKVERPKDTLVKQYGTHDTVENITTPLDITGHTYNITTPAGTPLNRSDTAPIVTGFRSYLLDKLADI